MYYHIWGPRNSTDEYKTSFWLVKLKMPAGAEGIKKKPICIPNTIFKEPQNYVENRIGQMVISQIHVQVK